MKRDILDDYRDFLMETKDRIVFQIVPSTAHIDEDGDVKQDFLLRMIIPGQGVAIGAAVVWVHPEIFPHRDYDEPCQTELVFHGINMPEYDEDGGQTVQEYVDGEWASVHIPPEPDCDDLLDEWLRGLEQ